MPETFGTRLRQRREERQIDLITIAKQTKISVSLLESLERDDVSLWPTGLYRRAFIRAYARAIDLDPDVVVREFLEVYPEPPEVDVIAAMASALGGGDRIARPGNRVRNVVDLAFGSLSRLRRGEPEPPVAGSAAPPIPPAPTADTVLDRQPDLPVTPPSAPVPAEIAPANDPPPNPESTTHQPAADVDLLAVADLCTQFALAANADEVQPLLQQASTLLNATGLIVWLWDASTAELHPALVHGYSPQVIAQLPRLQGDADNATALAFRSTERCAVAATEHVNGALVIPLQTAAGCTGVLAIELRRRSEQTNSTLAVATIVAALLAQMTTYAAPAESERLAVGGRVD